MANRGRKINTESENQFIKEIFFGKKSMNIYSNVWRDWPKPYRDIYSRMFSHNVTFLPKSSKSC